MSKHQFTNLMCCFSLGASTCNQGLAVQICGPVSDIVLSNNMWMYILFDICCKICTLGFRTSCTWGTMRSLRLSIWWKLLHCISRSPGTGLYHNLQRPRPWERNQLPETSLNVCVKDVWTSIQCLGHNGLKVGTFEFRQIKKRWSPRKSRNLDQDTSDCQFEIVVIPRVAWKANNFCLKIQKEK